MLTLCRFKNLECIISKYKILPQAKCTNKPNNRIKKQDIKKLTMKRFYLYNTFQINNLALFHIQHKILEQSEYLALGVF